MDLCKDQCDILVKTNFEEVLRSELVNWLVSRSVFLLVGRSVGFHGFLRYRWTLLYWKWLLWLKNWPSGQFQVTVTRNRKMVSTYFVFYWKYGPVRSRTLFTERNMVSEWFLIKSLYNDQISEKLFQFVERTSIKFLLQLK